jgi:hypothetical protein
MANRSATANVELHIGRLCNHNLERSIEACKEVETMMRREASTKTLVGLTDQLLVSITNQLQVLQKATAETHDLQLMSVNYTLLIAILRTVRFFFNIFFCVFMRRNGLFCRFSPILKWQLVLLKRSSVT